MRGRNPEGGKAVGVQARGRRLERELGTLRKRTRGTDGAVGEETPGEELLGERAADGGCGHISVWPEVKRRKPKPLCGSGERGTWQALKRSEACERMNHPISIGWGPAGRKTPGFGRSFGCGKDEGGASSDTALRSVDTRR